MAFKILADKIFSDILEIHASDHCNLSCKACSHLSPISEKFFPPTENLAALSVLARHYHARTLRLLGGEPLLRSDLAEFIATIRATKISDSIRLVTNGTLLHKVTPDLLGVIDSIEISFYPNLLKLEKLREFKKFCEGHQVSLYVRAMNHFRISHSEIGSQDRALVQKIYDSCKIAHRWSSQTYYNGIFFKCSNGPNLDREILKNNYASGLKISDDAEFFSRLKDYLAPTAKPIAACTHCLGTVGNRISYSQTNRSEWRELHKVKSEELLDYAYLESSLKNLDLNWDCADSQEELEAEFPSGTGIDNGQIGVW
jgi:cyclic pyranopterin phosphate synthase